MPRSAFGSGRAIFLVGVYGLVRRLGECVVVCNAKVCLHGDLLFLHMFLPERKNIRVALCICRPIPFATVNVFQKHRNIGDVGHCAGRPSYERDLVASCLKYYQDQAVVDTTVSNFSAVLDNPESNFFCDRT